MYIVYSTSIGSWGSDLAIYAVTSGAGRWLAPWGNHLSHLSAEQPREGNPAGEFLGEPLQHGGEDPKAGIGT